MTERRRCARYVHTLALAALTLANAVAQSRAPDRIAYSTFAPSNWDIFLFEEPGSEPRRLTNDPALDYDAAVSPDGRWLVFTSERRGHPDLFVLELADGDREPRLLIDSDALEDQAAFAPDGRSIAFVGTASGNAELYVLPFTPEKTVAMSTARNVTNDRGGDFSPAFSPDGRTLAFSSDRGLAVATPANPRSITRLRYGDIYALELASSATRRLTDAPGWDGSPAWSPDGKTLLFYSERGTRLDHMQTKLFAMNADGSEQRSLSTPAAIGELSPQFLPDGRITYARRLKPITGPWDEAGTWQVIAVRADGTDLQIIGEDERANYWKPTAGPRPGTNLAHGTGPSADADATLLITDGSPFTRSVLGRDVELYPLHANLGTALHPSQPIVLHSKAIGVDLTLTNLAVGGQRRLVEFGAPRNRPFGFGWSRDGEWIAFSRGGVAAIGGGAADGDVWMMRADGTDLINLTPDSTADDGYPSFSGDGKWLVYRSGTRGHYDLHLMKADGSAARRITDGAGNYLDPVFSPTANRIAFLTNRADPESVVFDVHLLELGGDYTTASIRQVTASDGQEGHVAFSHDGEWLIFTSEQGGIVYETPLFPQPQAYGEIYAYRIADGTTVRLTHNRWEEGAPSWEKAVSTR